LKLEKARGLTGLGFFATRRQYPDYP